MDQRPSFINLVITIAIVAAAALAAVLLRDRHPHTVPVKREPVTSPTDVAPALPGGPAQRPVEKNFLSFPKVQLVDSPANEADTLRVRLPEGEHVFVLYYIDALDTTLDHPGRINEQAHYFGGVTDDVIIQAGRAAMTYVKDLLNNHPFMLLTRWERVPDTDRYYALIQVELEKGKWAYLSDLLVRQGYARIAGVTTPLPGGSKNSEDDYLQTLRTGAKTAREKKRGIWGVGKGRK